METQEQPKNEEHEDSTEKDADDPYAYTKRNEFTSENFKIEIRGLPKFVQVSVSFTNELKNIIFFFIFYDENLKLLYLIFLLN